ncbi:MAG TPA: TonB-dependent receptor [Pyrinomonadaceae bacterium]|nr:TonB-dependent receptor [Pyrinomonadaceae bacterium]
MKSSKLLALVLCALALASAPPAFGQSDRGSITGTVTDPGGAVVAGARVTATNLDTGEVRETTTSGGGNYTLPELPADPYRLTVEAPGFKSTTIENVQVAVQVTRSLDVTLEVGVVTDVVTVTAENTQVIQTDTPVRQTNVTERQVRELPLQVSSEAGGRTPLSFIFLDSNVTSSGNIGGQADRGTNAARFRVAGGQAMGTEILIDGASTFRAQAGTNVTEISPGPNAYQEFTLSTSTYSAEFGRSSGGIINFTLKSGGNDFHGEVYELHRNEALNANSFLNNATGVERPRDLQHDFGFNIGGPVTFPHFGEGGPYLHKLRDRTFFFFNYEGYRFSRSETVQLTVPTERMRAGDFSELFTDPDVLRQFPNGVQIYDPRSGAPGSRTPFAGNIIPAGSFDPVGLAILQTLPRPQRPGVFRNYTATTTNPLTMNNAVFKIDQVITEAQRLSFSYSFRKSSAIEGGFARFPAPLYAFGRYDFGVTAHIARLSHDWTLSPTILNHFNAGFTRSETVRRNPAVGAADPFALGLPRNSVLGGAFPAVDFPGYGEPGRSDDVRSYQGIGGSFFNDLPFADNTVQLSDVVTFVRGRHTIRAGGDVRFQQFNAAQLLSPGGWFNFRHLQTANVDTNDQGWPIASLITGATEWSFNSSKTIDPGWRYFSPAMFIQDDIKVTQKLTLNVGVRYEISYPRTESKGRYRSFDPNVINPVTGRPGALVSVNGTGALKAEHEGLARPDYSNIGPRVGFAYAFNDKTVVRGGYGFYYSPILYGFGGDVAITEGTEGYNTHIARPQFGADANIFLSSYPERPPTDPNDQFIGQDVTFVNPNYRAGRTAQWSLDVQRELPANFAVSLGYIGHRATRLRSDFNRQNALPLEALRLGFPLLNKNLNDVTAQERAFAAGLGFPLAASSNAVFPGFNGSVAQSLRPFPHYANFRNVLESEGQSWYNALQAKLGRRFAQGMQFDVAYTFSKLITTGAEDLYGGSPVNQPQNPYERTRFVSPNSTPHVFVFNYILELPFGRGRRFLNEGGLVDVLAGGWQFGGIHRYQTGSPLVITSSRNTGFLNLVGFAGTRGAVLRVNTTGAPIIAGNDPNGTSFRLLSGLGFAQPPNFEGPPTTDVTDPAYAAYYADPSRFFGTGPTVLEEYVLPFYSENFSILKKTRITERVTLELRGEFFNIFNRHRYFGPDTNFANFDPNNPNSVGGFGISGVVGDPNVYAPRSVQVGARLIF